MEEKEAICDICGHHIQNEEETGYKEHHHVCDVCGGIFFFEEEYLKDRAQHDQEDLEKDMGLNWGRE